MIEEFWLVVVGVGVVVGVWVIVGVVVSNVVYKVVGSSSVEWSGGVG